MSRYRFIVAERGHYPVRRLCQVLGVPASGFYAWQQSQVRAVGSDETPTWETALVKVVGRHKRRYGTRRLRVALRQKGPRIGRLRLRAAMRRHGLHALQPKAFTPRTTDSTHSLRCAPNRLLDQPTPAQANRVWVSDITYLPLASGQWAYLCAFQDVTSKHVVGWHVAASMPEELGTTALQRAFLAQPATPGLLVHSDRGGQYCGNAYRELLHQHGALRSQSRRGECYDNAQAESLWFRLKTQVLELREWPVFADLADAQASVADYFNYYNHDRLHSSIDYQTPYHTHQQLLTNTALNCPA
ncbi:IS3 family transposase [Hymenobacter sp.]|jgi:transposase InsO family protein|uniref:IS3 family transposase n=1 Tax=Hymenobacter sp. TaxID=1898978 RepID=UPI002ED7E2F1